MRVGNYGVGIAIGDSMQPRYGSYTVLLYDTERSIQHGDLVVFEYKNKIIVHDYVRDADDLLVMKGTRNTYPEIITRDDIIGVVIYAFNIPFL